MATTTPQNPDTDESTTNEEKIVAELEAADEPLSLSELDERLVDVSYKGISASLSDLSAEDVVAREGEGGVTDPYRYKIDADAPDNGALDVLFGDEDADEDTDGDGLDALFEGDEPEAEDDTWYEYTLLPDDAGEDDVEFGTRYRARVNNLKPYGVFVSLNNCADWEDEVSGLAHKNHFPDNQTPDGFHEDDEVGVMLIEHSDDELDFEVVAALDTLRGKAFEKAPEHAPMEPPDAGPAFEGLTIKEREIAVAISEADGPPAVQELASWLVDRSDKGVGQMVRNLRKNDVVKVEGAGVRNDPYRYRIADDFEVPDDHGIDIPPHPDEELEREDVEQITDTDPDADRGPRVTPSETGTEDDTEPDEPDTVGAKPPEEDVSQSRTTRQIALEYVRTANADELVELWEASGVMPEDEVDTADVDFEGIPVDLSEDDWVDVVFAIGDSHIPIPETRELIGSVNRQVWGDGGPPDDREG